MSLSSATSADNGGTQPNPIDLLRAKLGIDELAQSVRELQSLARGQLVSPIVPVGGQQQGPRDWKGLVADAVAKIAEAIAKAPPPGDATTGQVMLQRLLQRDELMNQYLYKLIFGEMPARHVTVRRT